MALYNLLITQKLLVILCICGDNRALGLVESHPGT